MSRSRPLALGIAVGVLSVGGGVAVTQAASTPKSTEAPAAAPAAQADRAVEQRLGESLSDLAEKQGKPKKPDRSAAKLAPSAKQHRGRVSAARALRLTRQSAPDLALSSKLVPDESAVQEIISDRAIRVTGAGGADHTKGLLGEKNEKATRLVLSNLPMAALTTTGAGKDAKAEYELANIDWQSAGDRFTLKRPVSEVSLPKTAGGLVRLQNGLGVRLTDADSTAEGQASGETVTYPNIGTDADMVVRSLPTGFGVGWTLRSPDAAHTLRVPMDMPAGQHLREEPTHAVSVVDKDGEVQSEVTPATAVDADQQPVALTTRVEGDAIVYDVDHAEGKVAYPVTVDPYVYAKTYNTGQETSIDGWRAQNTPQASAPYQYVTPTGQQGSVLGIYGPAGYYAQNESAAWARYPPGNPTIGKGPSSGHGRWTQFIAGSVGYGYAPTTGVHYYNYASGQIFIADSAGNIQNSVGALPSGTSGQTFTVNASGGGLAIDNQIGFGLTLNGAFFTYDHPASAINMGYFQATADDPTPPSESTIGNAGWLDENGTVAASASDNGFGPKLIGLQTENSTPIGSYATRDCPTAQVTAAMVCPYTWSQTLPVAGAPQGTSTQYNVSCDANTSCSRAPFTLKLDTTPPDPTPSGDLYALRETPIPAGQTRPLTVTATDGTLNGTPDQQRTGVQRIAVYINDRLAISQDQGQAGDSQPLTLANWSPGISDLAAGSNDIRIEVTDRLGHRATRKFSVRRTPAANEPVALAGTGDLPRFELSHHDLPDGSDFAVNVANGNGLLHTADLAFFDTDRDYAVDRYFNSLARTAGPLGSKWQLAVGRDVRLLPAADNSAVVATGPTGTQTTFSRGSNGQYTSPGGTNDRLTLNADGTWTIRNAVEGTEDRFTAAGAQTSRTIDSDSGTLTETYDAQSGEIATLTDDIGRTITFRYANGRLAGIKDPSGAERTFSYDDAGSLRTVTPPSGATTTYSTYPDGRVSEIRSGSTATQLTYDATGRVRTVVDSSGTTTYSYATGDTTRTAPDGTVTHFYADSSGTVNRITRGTNAPTLTLTGPLNDGRNAAVSVGTYDLNYAATASNGVSDVDVYVDRDRVTGKSQDCSSTCGGLNGTWTLNTDDYVGGEHTVQVVATSKTGARQTTSFYVSTPAAPSNGDSDPDYDGPDPDPSQLSDIDGTECEQYYGTGSDFCFEDPEPAPASSALGAGTASSGSSAARVATAADSPASTDQATSSSSGTVSPRSTSTSTLIYGISQGDLGGSGDNVPDLSYFDDARYKALKTRQLRVVLPYNIMDRADRVSAFRAIYNKAKGTTPKTRLLVSLSFRCRPLPADNGSCYGDPNNDPNANERYVPSKNDYVDAVRRFKKAFPLVDYISAWNEPNNSRNSPVSARAMGNEVKGARRAALYTYYLVEDVCRKVKAKTKTIPCNVLAGDFDGGSLGLFVNYMGYYRNELTRRFKALGRPQDMPKAWGLHPYSDVQTKRAISKSTVGSFARRLPSGSRIFFSEVGVRADQSSDGTQGNLTEQAARVRYLIDSLATSRSNVDRVYYYTLCAPGQGADGKSFDPGLFGSTTFPRDRGACSDQPSRPAYDTFKTRSIRNPNG